MGFFDFLKRNELAQIRALKAQLEMYAPISNVNEEAAKRKREFDLQLLEQQEKLRELNNSLDLLKENYGSSRATYKALRKEVEVYESKIEMIGFGIYEPIYEFGTLEEYRQRQKEVVEEQKRMVKNETAAICETQWTVDGSLSKGKASTKRYIKLVLRAFNGECNALIAKAKWNNIEQLKTRITKSFEAINRLGKSQTISISSTYLGLKLQELALAYEYQMKKQEEKESLREQQEKIREEEKAKREYEKAQREAEKEERMFQKALEKAKQEMQQLSGEDQQKLQDQIAKLEMELENAHERKERALSMAQQTKRGHVYVISNIGSFGEDVYKIGLTRRLEPKDRVNELGDASVPFKFDIHAMIFSEEAPTLEKQLHRAFDGKKVNMLNSRKEFFNVSLEEIEAECNRMELDAEFAHFPEAAEYRETRELLARMRKTAESMSEAREVEEDIFPMELP